MKKQIIRVTPIQAAKVAAVLYFIMSIPIAALMAVSIVFSPQPVKPGAWFYIAIPFIYLIIGFIFTALGAWLYNLVAGWVGGIEYISEEKP